MTVFKLPLSGDVSQWINPINSWWSGNQISVNLGESGSHEVEAEILRRVGSYGRQLGKITDAVVVLLEHLPTELNLSDEEQNALDTFTELANDIARIKESHELKALRPTKRVKAV
jgi:hypothetical protein